MRPASVGHQCPECVSEGARTTRQARTVFGGRVTGDTSTVSIALVVANVAVFVLGLLLGPDSFRLQFANVTGPVLLAAGGEPAGVATGEYYRLITSTFLHAGVVHLLLNMFALAALGPQLETALGRLRFAVLYLLSALGGSAAGFLLAEPGQPSVGASGAIFGLFGAYYVVVRRLGGSTGQILGLLAVNLVITFALPFIDWRAHLGGLVTGALLAVVLAYAPRTERRTAVQAAGCGAVAALLVLLVVLRRSALGS